jgi:hypothetical protein
MYYCCRICSKRTFRKWLDLWWGTCKKNKENLGRRLKRWIKILLL